MSATVWANTVAQILDINFLCNVIILLVYIISHKCDHNVKSTMSSFKWKLQNIKKFIGTVK